MDKDIRQWLESSLYDLETARMMLKSGRFLYVIFCCQQAIEKMLKAKVVKEIAELPPKTHDLVKLGRLAKVQMDEEKLLFYRKITAYYIETRYPEEVGELAKKLNHQISEGFLNKTEEEIEWLKSTLK